LAVVQTVHPAHPEAAGLEAYSKMAAWKNRTCAKRCCRRKNLKSQLRELEIEEYSEVKLCTLEGNDRLRVLKVKPAA